MKINQFCSVCKEVLEMEVVPTGDGEDDGVLWLRCPRCQGFLPKISGDGFGKDDSSAGSDEADKSLDADDGTPQSASDSTAETEPQAAAEEQLVGPTAATEDRVDLPSEPVADSNVDIPVLTDEADPAVADLETLAPDLSQAVQSAEPVVPEETKEKKEPEEPPEPIADYQALLAEMDPASAVPYRPWDDYEKDDLIHHLAWDDCGLVVATETLPGNRHVVKVFFEKAGVVRLIVKDTDKP